MNWINTDISSLLILIGLLISQATCSATSCVADPKENPTISVPELQSFVDFLENSTHDLSRSRIDELLENNQQIRDEIDPLVVKELSPFVLRIDEIVRNRIQQNHTTPIDTTNPTDSAYQNIQETISYLEKNLQGVKEHRQGLQDFFVDYINTQVHRGVQPDRKMLAMTPQNNLPIDDPSLHLDKIMPLAPPPMQETKGSNKKDRSSAPQTKNPAPSPQKQKQKSQKQKQKPMLEQPPPQLTEQPPPSLEQEINDSLLQEIGENFPYSETSSSTSIDANKLNWQHPLTIPLTLDWLNVDDLGIIDYTNIGLAPPILQPKTIILNE